MGKKKRKHPDIEEVLSRPWCYYCERDFEDLKLLISHQKAKHFKCEECGRRLNTAGGLAVHLTQVHKETLTQVENALPNRQGLDIEIFGMEGIPQEVLEQHRNRIIQDFYQEQEDRRVATGNPVAGQPGKSPRKKIKMETAEELKARLAEWRAKRAAEKASGGAKANGGAGQAPAAYQPPPGQAPYAEAQYPPPGAAPPAYPQQTYPGYPATSLPPRPDGTSPAPPGLPQRPSFSGGYWNGPGAPPPGYSGTASTLDELVSGAAAGQQGDDIDQLIRMAEAGVKPQETAAAAPAKSKKDKARMFYSDADISPEERMAQLPRYALVQLDIVKHVLRGFGPEPGGS